MTGIRYTAWTAIEADDVGTALANDFKPDRALGHEKPYPATITLDRPQRSATGVVIFTRATVHYRDKTPDGSASDTWSLNP